jgi:hypothetical protein
MTGSGSGKNHPKTEKSAQSGSREARLAAALRENLRRRKAQERARGAGDSPDGEGGSRDEENR